MMEKGSHQHAGEGAAQVGLAGLFRRVHAVDGAPEGGGQHPGGLLVGEALPPHQKVDEIGDDLRVGQQAALVAVHLDGAPVGVVGGDLPVVHHRPVQKPEGVGPAPPARGVGGVPAVGGPAVGLVVLQAVKFPHVLGVAHGLEDPHVLPRGEDIGPRNLGVYPDDAPGGEGVLVQLALGEFRVQGLHKIPPDHRRVGDGRGLAGGDLLLVHHVEVALQKGLAGLLGPLPLIKDVKGVKLPVLRVDAVGGKAAPQPVGPVVHHGDGADDVLPVLPLPGFGKDGGHGAPGGDALAVDAFSQHGDLLPFPAAAQKTRPDFPIGRRRQNAGI